jgi:lipopolysaccharide/colanic/teichoic acid biosynthesis glycosyltransferase
MQTTQPKFEVDWSRCARSIKPTRSLRSIYTQEQTDHVIHRERCRADRAQQELSLVLFRVPRSIGRSRTALRVARTVLARSRATDDVGWFDDETICSILPDTSADGAGRFADNVCGALRDASQRPAVMVYTYPSSWFLDGVDGLHAAANAATALHVHRQAEASAPAAHPTVHASAHTTPHTTPQTTPHTTMDAGVQLGQSELIPFVVQGVTDAMCKQSEASVRRAPRSLEQLFIRPIPFWKRAIDMAGAAMALMVFGPLMLVIAVAIRLTSRGPAFFTQRRAGLGGRPFRIYKFRTMCTDAEARKQSLRHRSEQDGPAFKLANDPRVTRIGRILRKTSLDELPQLWNVLKGDMSLVGPRPLPLDEQSGVEQWQRARLEATPGLTCIWQVEGRSQVSFADWVRMDMKYLRRRSLMNDLKILAATVPAVLLRKGAR